MNRYQAEVAELDRKHRLTMRGLTLAGVATVVAAAFWSAGLPPSEIIARAVRWFGSADSNIDAADAPASQPHGASHVDVVEKQPAPTIDGLAGTDASVSPIPLPLYLLATKPGRNSREGTALLGTSIDNPQTYSAGALLVNGAQLAEVYADYVVLRRGSKEAKLALYKRSDVAARTAALQDLLTVGGESVVPLPPPVRRESLTDYLRPSPVYDGEVLKGYQVYPGQKVGVFSRMGLQAGDVITAIDDAPFADPEQAMQMFQQIASGVAVVATVERKSVVQRVTLDGALIAADIEQSLTAASSPAPVPLAGPI